MKKSDRIHIHLDRFVHMETEEKVIKAVILDTKPPFNYGKSVEKKSVEKINLEIIRAGLRGVPLN